MEVFLYIVKIAYYLAFVASLFFYARYKYKKNEINKFGWAALVLFSVAFGVYAVICSPLRESAGDRGRYAIRFEDFGYDEFTKKSSLGLWLLQEFLHIFTRDSGVLFFVVGLLFCGINLYCYKKTEKELPLFLLFLFLTNYALFGLFALKQALALAFVNLAFTEYWRKKKWWALVFSVVAILCHESALVVIPCVLIAEFCKKTDKRRNMVYIFSGLMVLLFPLIVNSLIRATSLVPALYAQLAQYLDEAGNLIIDFNFFTIFKYAAYYLTMIFAIIYRKQLKDKIENYDFLLILTVFCSMFSVLSMYMYWTFRFGMFFYVPVFLLAAQMCEKLYRDKRRVFTFSIISILLVFMVKLLIQYYFIHGGIV